MWRYSRGCHILAKSILEWIQELNRYLKKQQQKFSNLMNDMNLQIKISSSQKERLIEIHIKISHNEIPNTKTKTS